MDLKAIRAAMNADGSLSAKERLVIVALAVNVWRDGGKCKATVGTLAGNCHMSKRDIIAKLGALKKRGVVGVERIGAANVYTLNLAPAAPVGAPATVEPVGAPAPVSPPVPPVGAPVPVEPVGKVKPFSELTEADAEAAGARAGVSPDVARQVFAEMKANGGGYMTRGGVFVEVTSKKLQAAMRSMSRNVKPCETAANQKPKAHTPEQMANARELCAERCANFRDGKCGAGVKVLPLLEDCPPEECGKFKPTK